MRARSLPPAVLMGVVLLCGCSSDKTDPSASQTASGSTGAAGGKTAEAQSLLTRAEEFSRQRNFHKAIEALSQAIGADPDNAEAYLQRARVYAGLGQDANALADFNSAARIDPDHARVFNSRGFFFMSRQKFAEAEKDFQRAIQLDARFAAPHNNLGLAAVARGDFVAAIREFDAALAINPQDADAYNNRGFAHFRNGSDELAIADFERSIQLNPNDVNPYNNRGLLYFKQQEYRKAAADFSAAIALQPNVPKHYQHRQAAYEKLNLLEEAQADARRIAFLQKLGLLSLKIARQPGEPQRYLERGDLFFSAGEWESAIGDYNRALELNPQLASALSRRARVRFEQDQLQEAIADCEAALNIEPHHDAYSVRGDCHFRLGDLDRALADFTAAKRFDATVAQAYLLRSQQLEQRGQTEQAAADRQRAIALDPSLGTLRQ